MEGRPTPTEYDELRGELLERTERELNNASADSYDAVVAGCTDAMMRRISTYRAHQLGLARFETPREAVGSLSTTHKGLVGEVLVTAALGRVGSAKLMPVNNKDFDVELTLPDGRVARIEVKTGFENANGVMQVDGPRPDKSDFFVAVSPTHRFLEGNVGAVFAGLMSQQEMEDVRDLPLRTRRLTGAVGKINYTFNYETGAGALIAAKSAPLSALAPAFETYA